jgi:hypothetical protein
LSHDTEQSRIHHNLWWLCNHDDGLHEIFAEIRYHEPKMVVSDTKNSVRWIHYGSDVWIDQIMKIKKFRSNLKKRFRFQQVIKQKGKCPVCKRKYSSVDFNDQSPTVDHIISIHRGGKHTKDNYRVMCEKCNQQLAIVGDCIGALAASRAVTGRVSSYHLVGWAKRNVPGILNESLTKSLSYRKNMEQEPMKELTWVQDGS